MGLGILKHRRQLTAPWGTMTELKVSTERLMKEAPQSLMSGLSSARRFKTSFNSDTTWQKEATAMDTKQTIQFSPSL